MMQSHDDIKQYKVFSKIYCRLKKSLYLVQHEKLMNYAMPCGLFGYFLFCPISYFLLFFVLSFHYFTFPQTF